MKHIIKQVALSATYIIVLCMVVVGFYAGYALSFGMTPFSTNKPSLCSANSPSTSSSFSPPTSAQLTNSSPSAIFAKARANCILYVTNSVQDSSLENQWFVVPEGYFVQLLNTEASEAYKVAYGDKIGFVVPSSIKRVSFVPKVVVPEEQTLTTNAESGLILRKLASTSSEQVALIPPSSKVVYLASLSGDKPTDGHSTTWHYVRYFPSDQPTIYHEGYVYSERCTAPTILPNTEDESVADLNTLPVLPEEPAHSAALTPWLKGVVIALLCLPAFLFCIYLWVRIRRQKRQESAFE